MKQIFHVCLAILSNKVIKHNWKDLKFFTSILNDFLGCLLTIQNVNAATSCYVGQIATGECSSPCNLTIPVETKCEMDSVCIVKFIKKNFFL